MATWQFSVLLVPKKWAEAANFDATALVDGEFFDATLAFESYAPPVPIQQSVASTGLSPAKSWSSDLQCWGIEDGNDVQLWTKAGRIDSIGFRLDLRTSVQAFAAQIEAIARDLECYIFVPEQQLIVKPEPGRVLALAASSSAARFVADPRAYLAGLRGEA